MAIYQMNKTFFFVVVVLYISNILEFESCDVVL